VLTDEGKRAYEAAMDLQAPWVNNLSNGLAVKDIQTINRVIVTLRQELEANERQVRA
jgi:hypothetical protein